PLASAGQLEGSQRDVSAVAESPAFRFAINLSYSAISQCTHSFVSSPRAAVRPSVENNAAAGTFSAPSASVTTSLYSVLPLAKPTSIRASGPTSIALPFQPGADRRPVRIERCHRQQIGNVHALHHLLRVLDQPLHIVQPLHVDGVVALHGDRRRHPAHQIIRVRILSAEDGVDLDDLLLPL